mmetsp:Transcript_19040/g.26254  ORF Transcript_19040/g.26254 Transcript_19040/m.26254 type:complete len:236 (-) Transcript_19040:33-740(-)
MDSLQIGWAKRAKDKAKEKHNLEKNTSFPLVCTFSTTVVSTNNSCQSFIKHILQPLTSQSRTLKILNGLDLLGHFDSLLSCDWVFPVLLEILNGLLVSSQICLCSNKDDGDSRAMMADLPKPTIFHVNKRRIVGNRESKKKNISFGVRQGSNARVTLLTSGIPKREFDFLAFNKDSGFVVVEDGWDILLGKLSLGVTDQHTSFSDSTIPNNNTLNFQRLGHSNQKTKKTETTQAL